MSVAPGHLFLGRSVTNESQVTSTTNSAVIPAGAQPGDLCVHINFAGAASAVPTAVTPTNFTNSLNLSDAANFERFMINWKVLVSGDAGSTVSGMSNSRVNALIVVRPQNFSISSITTVGGSGQWSASAPTNQTLAVADGKTRKPLLVFAYFFANSGTVGSLTGLPSTTTLIPVASRDEIRFGHCNDYQSCSDAVVSMADFGTNRMFSQAFVLN